MRFILRSLWKLLIVFPLKICWFIIKLPFKLFKSVFITILSVVIILAIIGVVIWGAVTNWWGLA